MRVEHRWNNTDGKKPSPNVTLSKVNYMKTGQESNYDLYRRRKGG
jgi:hypothetical protein